jgi:High potential iron-sulfur protein
MSDANFRGNPLTRRAVVKNLGLAAGLSAVLPWHRAQAAEPARLDVKDPAAIAQAYVLNAAQVDAKKYPQYTQGSSCENCLLLQGTAGNNYRPCSLFPGKLVSVSGWCKGWTAEM